MRAAQQIPCVCVCVYIFGMLLFLYHEQRVTLTPKMEFRETHCAMAMALSAAHVAIITSIIVKTTNNNNNRNYYLPVEICYKVGALMCVRS